MLTFVQAPPEPGVRRLWGEMVHVECRPPSFDDYPVILWLEAHAFRTVTLLENLVFPSEQCFYTLLRLLYRRIVPGCDRLQVAIMQARYSLDVWIPPQDRPGRLGDSRDFVVDHAPHFLCAQRRLQIFANSQERTRFAGIIHRYFTGEGDSRAACADALDQGNSSSMKPGLTSSLEPCPASRIAICGVSAQYCP